jgi:hypothetical protein
MKINSKWIPWNQRNNITKKDQPAIYYIAYSEVNIEGNDFETFSGKPATSFSCKPLWVNIKRLNYEIFNFYYLFNILF